MQGIGGETQQQLGYHRGDEGTKTSCRSRLVHPLVSGKMVHLFLFKHPRVRWRVTR